MPVFYKDPVYHSILLCQSNEILAVDTPSGRRLWDVLLPLCPSSRELALSPSWNPQQGMPSFRLE